MKLHENLIAACSAYLSEFANMYEWENENEQREPNGIYHFADMTFSFNDIVYCVNNNVPKGVLLAWYDENFRNFILGKVSISLKNYVLYFKGEVNKTICIKCGSSEHGFYRRHRECKKCYNLKVYGKKIAIANKHGFDTYYQYLKHTNYKKIL